MYLFPDGSLTLAFDAGISLDVFIQPNHLSVLVKVSEDLKTQPGQDSLLEGLLGNIDDEANNDLKDPDGVVNSLDEMTEDKFNDYLQKCKFFKKSQEIFL